MKTILIYFVLFNLNAFLLTCIILGVCFLAKILLSKKTWTEFFQDLTILRSIILFLFGASIFEIIAYNLNSFFFHYFDFSHVSILATSIPSILILLFLLLIRKGKQYFMKDEPKQTYDTIYK